MSKHFKRILSAVLIVAMLLSCMPEMAFAAQSEKPGNDIPDATEYLDFPRAGVTEETKATNVFYFGSTNLTVSEKSEVSRLLRICRGGEAAEEASVTVKFGDYSAVYGENYTVDLYKGDGVLTLNPYSLSVVDFLVENADSFTEFTEEEVAEEEKEMLEQLVENGGADIRDVNGNLISTMSLTKPEDADDEEAADQETDEEKADYVMSVEQEQPQEEFDSNMSDYMAAAQVKLTFAPGETEKYIVINPLYSPEAQGNAQVEITLDNPSAGMYLPDEGFLSVMTIADEDEVAPAVLSIADTELSADGDTVTITVTREGAINNMVAAKISTSAVTAVEGEDYQGVYADLAFPMGILTRTFDIQLNHRYNDTSAAFKVTLDDPTGAVLDNDECLVTILPDSNTGKNYSWAALTALYANNSENGLDNDKYNINSAGAYGSAYSTITSEYSFRTDTRGDCPYDTKVYVHVPFTPYVYDGIQVRWKVTRSVATYGYIRAAVYDGSNRKWDDLYNRDCGAWGWDTDNYFFPKAGSGYNSLEFSNYTSSCSGKLNEIDWIKMYHMKYNVTLEQAEPLDYLGVSTAEEQDRVGTFIAGSSLETTKKEVYSTDSITITAMRGGNYAQLTGLMLIDKDGNKYDVKNIDSDAAIFSNGTSVTLNLTEKLLRAMGDNLTFKKEGNRTIGELKIQPVFSYVDADVEIRNLVLERGSAAFAGDISRQFHVGDVISFNNNGTSTITASDMSLGTVITDPTYEAVGYDAEFYPSSEVSTVTKRIAGEQYSNGSASLLISTPKVIFYPRVSSKQNQVTVRVKKSLVDSGAFDTAQGIFLYPKQENDNYYDYIISDTGKPLSADIFFSASAIPTDSDKVANWQLAKDSTVYSGNVMYFYSKNNAQDNMITLTLSDSKKDYTITGMVCSDSRSIATGLNTNVLLPAAGAAVAVGDAVTSSDMETAAFTLENVAASPKTTVRLMVYYNNTIVLKDVALGSLTTAVDVGQLQLSTNNGDTAYVSNIYLELGGVPMTSSYALPMNGKKLELYAEVKDGNTYEVDKVTKTEKATKVTFMVLDGKTYEIKSAYTAVQDADDPSIWKAEIGNLSPEYPEEYTYGDLIYVQLVTDRELSSEEDMAALKSTTYDPMATGYAIAAGGDFQPKQFEFNAPISAEVLMAGLNDSPAEGSSGSKKHFAKLPIIGNLNLSSFVLGNIKFGKSVTEAADDYVEDENEEDDEFEDDDDDESESGDDSGEPAISGTSKVAVRINVYTKTLSDGRLRLNIGVTFTYGNNKARSLQNPYDNMNAAYDMIAGKKAEKEEQFRGMDVNKEVESYNKQQTGTEVKNAMRSNLSGVQMTFTASFGVYFDFVLPADDNGITGFYWVGVGGYLGFSGNLHFVRYIIILPFYIPAYIGFNAGASLTGYLGGTKDITQYLEDIEDGSGTSYDDFIGQDKITIDDSMGFTADGNFSAYLQGFAGVGVCNVLGLRLNLTLSLSIDYVHKMKEWYPNIGTNWGVTTDLAIGGQADLFVTSIPFNGLSVPLASIGFNEYFTALRRGMRMMNIVDKADNSATLKAAEPLKTLYNTVHEDVNSRAATTEKLVKDVYALYDYIYEHADDFDMWKSSVYMLYHTDSDVYDLMLLSTGDQETNQTTEYSVKQPTDSIWTADKPALKSAFSGNDNKTLVKNGYDNPDSQLVSIGDGKMALFFLADPGVLEDHSWAGEKQTSVLVYSIYNGSSWSKPKAVEKNATNDFYPNVVVCGDQLMVSWVSSDPNAAKVRGNDLSSKEKVIDLFTSMEVYSAIYDIATDSILGIEQLTNDEFTDLCPQGVYDSTTGDRAVYYIKTAIDTELEAEDISLTDFVNFYSDTTYSMVCYMLYDADFDDETNTNGTGSGAWLRDYYFENEMKDDRDPEDYLQENGQRYLPSVLEIMKAQGLVAADADGMNVTVESYKDGETVSETNYIDPPITDLAVCEGYNGLAVYAYTVDMDQNMNTDEDKELFIQLFDFETHKTYHPIRLSSNHVSESRPKLVRSGDSTYLFWLYGGEAIKYVNVSNLLRDYVDADGNIVTEYYTKKPASEGNQYTSDAIDDYDGTIYYKDAHGIYKLNGSTREYVEDTESLVRHEYTLSYNTVTSTTIESKQTADVGDYEVVMDNEQNIYILWTQVVPNENAKQYDAPTTEVFASALIKTDSDSADGWSSPYQLTRNGKNADGVCAAISSDGNLVLVYNSYEVTYIGDSEEFIRQATVSEDGTKLEGNPYKISPTSLMASKLEPCGAMSATSIGISNLTPKAGETVYVTAVIENTGLTTAKDGYTVDFYTSKNGVKGEKLTTVSSSEPMPANGSETVTFAWVVPEDMENVCIEAIARENGYSNSDTTFSKAMKKEANYNVELTYVEQLEGEKFTATYAITNNGNAASPADDKIKLRFAALYQSFENYGLDTDELAIEELGNLQPGETRSYTTTFTVPAQAFDLIGFDELAVEIVDTKNEDSIKAGDTSTLRMTKPLTVTLNDNEAVTMKAGETTTVKVDYGNKWLNRYNTVNLTSADPDIVQIGSDGSLIGVGEGKTTVTATVLSTGMETRIQVTVYGKDEPTPIELPFKDVKQSDWFFDAVAWAYENHLMIGTAEDTFSPDAKLNRAMIATILYRYEGEPTVSGASKFTDVPEGMWYSDAIAWAEEAGIVIGYGNGTYGPNDPVTREQFAVIMHRYAKAKGDAADETCDITGYDDYDKISSWAEESVAWAVAVGIMQGSDINLMPLHTATRAQTAAILYRYVTKPENER